MKEIRFEYTYFGRRKSFTATVPEKLGEASSNQFIALLSLSEGAVTEEQFFKLFFGIGSDILSRLDPWQLYVMTEQLRTLWEMTAADHFFIPELSIDSVRLVAPEDRLRGMTLKQFMTVDQFWQWYAYSGNNTYLYAMVAALYLPENTDFFSYDHGALAESIAKSEDLMLLQGITVNWALIRNWLSDAYPHLFPSAEQDSSNEAPSGRKKQRPGSWLAILDALVGDDLTRLETYPHLLALDVIRILDRRIKEQKKPRI